MEASNEKLEKENQPIEAEKTPSRDPVPKEVRELWKDQIPEVNLDTIDRTKEKPATFREKLNGSRQFLTLLHQPQNSTVARGFFIASFAMFVLPLVVFAVCQQVVAQHFVSSEDDNSIFAGFAAVATTLVVVIVYAIWAIQSDAKVEAHAKPNEEWKKKQ